MLPSDSFGYLPPQQLPALLWSRDAATRRDRARFLHSTTEAKLRPHAPGHGDEFPLQHPALFDDQEKFFAVAEREVSDDVTNDRSGSANDPYVPNQTLRVGKQAVTDNGEQDQK